MGPLRTLTTDDGTRLTWQVGGEDAAAGAPLLLLGGATWSMDWWEDDLCEELAASRPVVRFDARDTGGSTQWPVGEPGYGPDELAADALAVARAAGATRFHAVGLSMGGGLAQRLAATAPERVVSMTLVSTSPADADGLDLAPPTEALMATFAEESPTPDWSDPAAAVDALVEGERAFAGPDGWDEPRLRALAARVVARTPDLAASLTNHLVAVEREGATVRAADVARVPALVVHGDADPLFPGHGAVLAEQLGASYVELPGVGHQLPPPHLWPLFVDAVLSHAEAGAVSGS
ncbi:alpha/beta hydrolase [uncultured Nocardioides sp.]|uniref:alpha/beta fold hydrolase n=1 Tax=uncultured Nocardioides sp. TaxID=198441 RepID=UPI00262D90AC|nr:alpha/beta hydrolase [uncultured Nocardioides sp.]